MSAHPAKILLCLWAVWCSGSGSAQTAAEATAGDIVAGRIVSAADGHGLAQAHVTLYDTVNDKQVSETTAGPDGSFAFPPMPAGRWRMSGNTEGYVTSAYLHHDQLSSAIVTGAGLETSHLVLELTPQGEIQGRVLGEGGEPVAQAQVQLFRESPPGAGVRVRQTRQTQTDDSGEFDFTGLVPGRFYLAVRAKPWYATFAPQQYGDWMPYRTAVDPALQVTYPLTFYPNGHRSEEASPLDVHPGDTVSADFQLTPEPAVTLSVQMPKSQAGQTGMMIPQIEETIFGSTQPVPANSQMGPDGLLHFVGMAQGQYTLRTMRAGEEGGNATSQVVDLRSSAVTLDANTAEPAVPVHVTVHMNGGRELPSGLRVVLAHEGDYNDVSETLDGNGVAEFKGIAAGEYEVRILARNRLPPVQQISVGGRIAADRHLHVQGTGSLAVDLLLAGHTVRVQGTALRQGKPAVATQVVLVPAGADTSPQLFRRDQSDLDGGFTLPNVPPGNYVLVALDEGWQLNWTDTATMLHYLPHGIPLTVPETGGAVLRVPEPVIVQAH